MGRAADDYQEYRASLAAAGDTDPPLGFFEAWLEGFETGSQSSFGSAAQTVFYTLIAAAIIMVISEIAAGWGADHESDNPPAVRSPPEIRITNPTPLESGDVSQEGRLRRNDSKALRSALDNIPASINQGFEQLLDQQREFIRGFLRAYNTQDPEAQGRTMKVDTTQNSSDLMEELLIEVGELRDSIDRLASKLK